MSGNDKIILEKDIPKINIDGYQESKRTKKPKGWGHWNNYLKSDEYTKLIPGNEEITEEELATHNTPGDLWIGLTYEKRVCVFDVTTFAEFHPGGYDIIKSVAGRDATEDFRLAHAYVNPNMIARFKKGYLVRTSFKSPNSLSPGMTTLAPVKKPTQTNKPKWNWSESEDVVILKMSLHKTVHQKLDSVSVICEENNNFKLRIFFDTEYYYFEISLHSYLSPLLDSIECDENGKSLSIKFLSKLGYPTSTLGGIVKDCMASLTDSAGEEEFLPCTLVSTRDLNYDCREFKIQWPNWVRVSIPLGHHVLVQAVIGGETVQRPYTPVCEVRPSKSERKFENQFTLMIKRYGDGQLSSFMHSLDEDSILMVSLPTGTFSSPTWIQTQSKSLFKSLTTDTNSVVFMAAGSGITPMIRMVLNCLIVGKLNCHLLFFNKSQRDIIYLKEFEALTSYFTDKFQVTHILSQPDSEWTGFQGRISSEIFKEILVDKFSKRFYMVCGPLGFMKSVMEIFQSLRVDRKQIFEFKG